MSADTAEIRSVVAKIRENHPTCSLVAVWYDDGNVLEFYEADNAGAPFGPILGEVKS